VVIPAYNEVGAIAPCIGELAAILDAADFTSEILVVDDGSTDGTGEKLREIECALVLQRSKP